MNGNLDLDNDEIALAKQDVEKSLALISALSKDQKRQKNDDVKVMINYYNDLTQKIEDRRTKLIDQNWQALALSITILGLVITNQIMFIIKLLAIILLIILILFSVLKIREYRAQSSFRYPFLKLDEYGNKWKWFYYGNPFVKSISTDPFSKETSENISNYLLGLDLFLTNYSNETLEVELNENLQQLYLLQVHNYYKNKFYLRLLDLDRKAQNWIGIGLLGYVIIMVITVTVNQDLIPILISGSLPFKCG